jgi:hypothetical protein
MWEFASIVERARQASATVSRLEAALARDPNSPSLQINLAASKKRALQSNSELQEVASYQRIDICNYRLVASVSNGFFVQGVSGSLLGYQLLFSQVYDALKNGPKGRAQIGKQAGAESALELAFTYSGSLGIVLFAPNERNFFEGQLDKAIDSTYSIIEADSRSEMQEIARTFGGSVIKRLHDWSEATSDGGYSADVRWSRSDGKHLGTIYQVDRLRKLVDLTAETSDKTITTHVETGFLNGGDITSRTFHFVVPNGRDFRGSLGEDFSPDTEMILGGRYRATIRETMTTVYATEKIERELELMTLSSPTRPPVVPSSE